MAKKTFKDAITNPAELFISSATETRAEEKPALETPTEAPKGYKVNPIFIETKSKRLQLLIRPSTVESLKAEALKEGKSLNDLVNSILEAHIKENK